MDPTKSEQAVKTDPFAGVEVGVLLKKVLPYETYRVPEEHGVVNYKHTKYGEVVGNRHFYDGGIGELKAGFFEAKFNSWAVFMPGVEGQKVMADKQLWVIGLYDAEVYLKGNDGKWYMEKAKAVKDMYQQNDPGVMEVPMNGDKKTYWKFEENGASVVKASDWQKIEDKVAKLVPAKQQ